MSVWLFSSSNLDHIRRAYERLVWGFWDRPTQAKTDFQRRLIKNWRSFIRMFNRIKPFDYAVIQIAGSGHIHALGVIKSTGYDDQTPIWDKEIQQRRVLFPWRVYFSFIIFSERPITTLYTKISDYIDGYGISELPIHELRHIIDSIDVRINIGD